MICPHNKLRAGLALTIRVVDSATGIDTVTIKLRFVKKKKININMLREKKISKAFYFCYLTIYNDDE